MRGQDACDRCARVAAASSSAVITHVEDRTAIKRTLWLYFSLLAVSIALVIFGMIKSDERSGLFAEWIAQGAHTAIVLLFVAISWPIIAPSLRRAGRWYWYPIAIVAACVTFVTTHLVVNAMTSVLRLPHVDYTNTTLAQGFGLVAIVLSVSVQPGVVEELAFRGLIQPFLGRTVGTIAGIAAASLMFMVLHLSPLSFPHLLAIGLALGLLRHASGSLYPCILMHMTHNLLVALNEMYGLLWS